jgi:hypothetical protein
LICYSLRVFPGDRTSLDSLEISLSPSP